MQVLAIPYATLSISGELRFELGLLLLSPEAFGFEARLATDNVLSRVSVTDTSLNVPERLKYVTSFLKGEKPYQTFVPCFRLTMGKHLVSIIQDGMVMLDVPAGVSRQEFVVNSQNLEIYKLLNMLHQCTSKFGTAYMFKLEPNVFRNYPSDDAGRIQDMLNDVCKAIGVRPYSWATFIVVTEKKQLEKAQTVLVDARRVLKLPSFMYLEEAWLYYANHTAVLVLLYSTLNLQDVEILSITKIEELKKGQNPDMAEKLRKVFSYLRYG